MFFFLCVCGKYVLLEAFVFERNFRGSIQLCSYRCKIYDYEHTSCDFIQCLKWFQHGTIFFLSIGCAFPLRFFFVYFCVCARCFFFCLQVSFISYLLNMYEFEYRFHLLPNVWFCSFCNFILVPHFKCDSNITLMYDEPYNFAKLKQFVIVLKNEGVCKPKFNEIDISHEFSYFPFSLFIRTK